MSLSSVNYLHVKIVRTKCILFHDIFARSAEIDCTNVDKGMPDFSLNGAPLIFDWVPLTGAIYDLKKLPFDSWSKVLPFDINIYYLFLYKWYCLRSS